MLMDDLHVYQHAIHQLRLAYSAADMSVCPRHQTEATELLDSSVAKYFCSYSVFPEHASMQVNGIRVDL